MAELRGLAALAGVSQLHVKERRTMTWEVQGAAGAAPIDPMRYLVTDAGGRPLYRALAATESVSGNVWGPHRPFEMDLTTERGAHVLHLRRPLGRTWSCRRAWTGDLEVTTSNGRAVGTISQRCSLRTRYVVLDGEGVPALYIVGPINPCAREVFSITGANGRDKVGTMTELYAGLIQSVLEDAHYYEVTFPKDMEDTLKALLLAACILVYFDKSIDDVGAATGALAAASSSGRLLGNVDY